MDKNSILGQYKALKVTRRVRPVSEKAVEQELVHQTRLHAVYHPSASAAKLGSRVLIDFEGFMGGEAIPDSKMEKVMVVLGDGSLMADAEKAICGRKAGEEFSFDFTYPADFRLPELAGKTAQFNIKLHSVAEKETPKPDEAFAKAMGFDTLEALKADIRKKKAAVHEANADRVAEAELLEKAAANCNIALDPLAVDRLAAQDLAKLEQKLKRSNMTLADHCKKQRTTPEALRAEYVKAAEKRMRAVITSKAIAEAENITVSTAEVNNEYHRLSQLHETPEDEIRKVLPPESIAAAIASHKVQEFLLANAEVKTAVEAADKE